MKSKNAVQPLREVRIMGPDSNGAFADLLTDGFSETDGCLLIGDGKVDIMPDRLLETLKERVDGNTKIHLCAHGNVVSSLGHTLLLNEGLSVPTIEVLKMLDGLTDDPVQIYMDSCHSGAANEHVTALKKGSVLVTVSDPTSVSLSSPFGSSFKDGSVSAEITFVSHLRDASETVSYNKCLADGDCFKYTYRPFDNRLVRGVDTVQKYIQWAECDYADELAKSGVCREEELLALKSLPLVSEEHAKHSVSMHMLYLTMLGKEVDFDSLLKCGADIKSKDKSGSNLLHYTAVMNNAFDNDLFQALVERIDDVNAKNRLGYTPLMMALFTGNERGAQILLDTGKVNPWTSPDIYEKTLPQLKKILGGCTADEALSNALDNEDIGLAVLAIRHGADQNMLDSHGRSILHIAAARDDAKSVGDLLSLGVDPEVRFTIYEEDFDVEREVRPMSIALVKNNVGMVKDLLDAGANPWFDPEVCRDARDDVIKIIGGRTPVEALVEAVQTQDVILAERAIKFSKGFSAQDLEELLEITVKYDNQTQSSESLKIVKLIIKAGADVKSLDYKEHPRVAMLASRLEAKDVVEKSKNQDVALRVISNTESVKPTRMNVIPRRNDGKNLL